MSKNDSLPWRILDASDALHMVLDAGGRIVFANRRFCRWMDATPDDMQGLPWFEAVVAPKARQAAEADFPRLSRARSKQQLHYPVISPDGIEVVLDWQWSRIPGRLGIPGTFLLTGSHAGNMPAGSTKTGNANTFEIMTLEKARALLERLFSATNIMFAYLDPELRFVRVNDAFATYHQLEAKQFLGMPFSKFHPEADIFALLQDVIRNKQGQRRQIRLVTRHIHIDSDWFVQPVLDRHGEVEGVLISILDITERMQIRDRLEQTNHLLRDALSGTVEAISRAEEARDPYTAGHQRRVAQLSVAIAREMGLSADRVEGIRLGAMIHDIGKIQTPAELLSKPTKLSPFEYEIVKQHAVTGYEILKDIPFPWPIAQIAYQHHERLDGTGYPQGLKKEDILIEARIVAVADVVEAMGFHRPYRPAIGIEAALAELRKHQGRYYDSEAVDTCLRLFAEERFTFET